MTAEFLRAKGGKNRAAGPRSRRPAPHLPDTHSTIAVFIAVVSIFGAVVAAHGALAAQRASEAERQHIQALMLQQRRRLELQGRANYDRSGRYRVEFYVNGRLAATRIIKTDLPDFQAADLSDLTLRMCYPAAWQRAPKSRFGLVSGYTEGGHSRGGHSRGAFLFRFRHPWGVETPPRVMDEHIRRYIRWAFGYMGLPQDAKRERTFDKASFLGSGFDLARAGRASYTYRGVRILTGVGVSRLGSVLIGVVYGPADYFDGPEPTYILDSMR